MVVTGEGVAVAVDVGPAKLMVVDEVLTTVGGVIVVVLVTAVAVIVEVVV